MNDIRLVESEEQIAGVEALARDIWQDHYVPIIGQVQVDYMLASLQSAHAIATQIGDGYRYYRVFFDDQPVGYFSVLPKPAEMALMLSKIYVKRSTRGRGLGRSMLAFVEALCREGGLRTIWLTVNKNNRGAIQWYARNGFSQSGSLVQDIGGGFVMDDFRMEKSIA